MIFGAIIGAGIVGMLIAPLISRMLRYFPPVVTGTIILVIGISLMKIGIGWIFGNPVGPTAPRLVDPDHAAWLAAVKGLAAGTVPDMPPGLALAPTVRNPAYASTPNMLVSAVVLMVVLMVARYARGFLANIAVLSGIVAGAILAAALGMMTFAKVGAAGWFALITPLHFGFPIFDPVMILTFVLVMIVVMIESTGMFLALGEMTGKKVDRGMLTAGLRTDGLGTLIGGLFNTFPYTSFSQNVGLVGVTGVRSRYVCVAGGLIMVVLGLIPKISAVVEALPTAVLGGAGLVMFGMVAATGVRILGAVNFRASRANLFIVAISVGFGMIPLVAPDFKMWMPAAIHPLIDSGILLASISAVALNVFFNGAGAESEDGVIVAALASDGGH
jgi:NCS2 family nucleobase:cation symporter-2